MHRHSLLYAKSSDINWVSKERQSHSTSLESMEERKSPVKEWQLRSQLQNARFQWCSAFIFRFNLGTNPLFTLISRRNIAIWMLRLTTIWIWRGSKWFWGKTTTICFPMTRTEKISVMTRGLSRQNSNGHLMVPCQNIAGCSNVSCSSWSQWAGCTNEDLVQHGIIRHTTECQWTFRRRQKFSGALSENNKTDGWSLRS